MKAQRTRQLCGGLLVAASLSLAGCSSLPTAGSPHAFDVDVPSPSAVDFVAGAPTKGASPEALVEAFLRACSAGTSDNFDTARLFLTQRSARTWVPSAAVHVYATDATPLINIDTVEDGSAVFVAAPLVATVDGEGNLTEAAHGTTLQMRYRVVKEKGEWRIDAPDNGIILSAASFTATHQLSQVFFPVRSSQTLTSEAHWYPRKQLARRLMEALIAGPSQNLAPAVDTAIPADAILPADGVEVTDGSAVITLEGTVPDNDKQKTLMAWQIFHTMRQSAQVSDVQATIAGAPLDMSNLPAGPKYRLEAAIARSQERVGVVTAGEFTPLSQFVPAPSANETAVLLPTGELPEERWEGMPKPPVTSRIAMSPTNPGVVAWVGDGQLTVVDRGTKQNVHMGASNASWPSVDRFGWAWSVAHGGSMALLHPSGAKSALNATGTLTGATHVRISPDGSRAAFMRRLGNQVGVWVATVERDKNGVPLEISAPVALPRLAGNVRDISWASSTTVVALQGASDDEMSVVTAPLGGFTTAISAPDGAEFLTGGASAQSLFVTDDKGAVWSRVNSVWQPIEAQVVSVRFPG